VTQMGLLGDEMGATFSPCEKADEEHVCSRECRPYRYTLWRVWDPGKPLLMFVGLNPSTATDIENDPTVTRCIDYARRWGFGGLVMMNLFAFRATDPKEMKGVADPVGPENDAALEEQAQRAGLVIAAWGTHGTHHGRARKVIDSGILGDYKVLCVTGGGHPGHPLYLPAEWEPLDPADPAARRSTRKAARA
jgi:hypothetical protein